jgi:hypothetical protein
VEFEKAQLGCCHACSASGDRLGEALACGRDGPLRWPSRARVPMARAGRVNTGHSVGWQKGLVIVVWLLNEEPAMMI